MDFESEWAFQLWRSNSQSPFQAYPMFVMFFMLFMLFCAVQRSGNEFVEGVLRSRGYAQNKVAAWSQGPEVSWTMGGYRGWPSNVLLVLNAGNGWVAGGMGPSLIFTMDHCLPICLAPVRHPMSLWIGVFKDLRNANLLTPWGDAAYM